MLHRAQPSLRSWFLLS